MIRRICFVILTIIIGGVVFANTDRIYLYRNDRNFNVHNTRDILGISHYEDSIISEIVDKQMPSLPFLQVVGKDTIWEKVVSGMDVKLRNGSSLQVPFSAIDSVVTRPNDIPDIRVWLLDFPELNDLIKDDNHDKRTVYRAEISIDGNGSQDDLEPIEVEFRGRGNSTWYMPKTPYRFKFPKKRSICGLQKAKTYALIANWIDPSFMRNEFALAMARELGMPYTNHSVPVNVYLNGKPRGLYMLTEKIGINSASVDIDEEKGVLFELDNVFDEEWKFNYDFKLNSLLFSLPVNVKDPDFNEVVPEGLEPKEYFEMWRRDFCAMADSVMSGGELSAVINLDQLAKLMLVNTFCANKDIMHPKSCFLYKRELGDTELYQFGPAWDYDWALDFQSNDITLLNDVSTVPGNEFFLRIVKRPEFQERFAVLWDNFRMNLLPEIKERLHALACQLEPSAKLNGLIWPERFVYNRHLKCSFDYEECLNDFFTWLEEREEFINTHPVWGLYPPSEGECPNQNAWQPEDDPDTENPNQGSDETYGDSENMSESASESPTE